MQFSKKDVFILLFLIIIGGFLRLYRLDLFPPGLHGDEAWAGIEARRIIENGSIGIWSPASYGEPALRFYYVAAIFKLLGESISSLRFSSALLNTLSIPFFYGTVLLLFGRRIAFFATFLFSLSFVNLLFARVAHLAPYSFTFYPTLFFLLLGLRKKRLLFFLIGGIFLGLTFYSYFALWPTFLLLGIYLIYLFFREKKILSTYWLQLSIFFLIAFLVSFPILSFGIKNKDVILARYHLIAAVSENGINKSMLEQKSKNVGGFFIENLKKNIFMFFQKGDSDPQDNIQDKPLFNLVGSIFLIIGFAYSLINIKKTQFFFLIVWFLFFILLASITADAPNYRRTQLSIAASYIFIAIILDAISNQLKHYFSEKLLLPSWFFLLTSTTIIGYIGVTSMLFFFRDFSQAEMTKFIYSYPLVKISELLNSFKKPIYVYFYSSRWSYSYEPMRFLDHDIPGEDRSSQFGNYSLMNNNLNKSVVYLFLPDYQHSFIEIQKIYPGGKIIVTRDVNDTVLFYSYLIDKEI